jgi:hypothetical protein
MYGLSLANSYYTNQLLCADIYIGFHQIGQ